MKICDTHWAKLRELIEARSMTHLIKTGQENMETMVDQINGEPTSPKDYDPLMAANFMVMGQALKQGGLYMMGQKPDGSDYCPICEAVENMAKVSLPGKTEPVGAEWVENHWTVGVVDSIHEHCRRLGLLPVN